MGNHVKARPRAKPKRKSVKAKITRKMGSKRRTQKMGKELKKGQKGAAASYLTRAKVLRRLQISLRDFRRLCILKGVYPRDPSKKVSGKDKTYYHIKDVGFLEHEPVLQSFRDFKAFMRKLRRSIGRNRLIDAQRRELNERPVYKLDHLVKERYPRFLDAVRDLDDALSLVHLFASLPQMKQRTSAHSETCKRLVKEWAFYVSKARCLTKAFVSIKGVYFQAEVLGQPVTWITPHVFTLYYPRDVDFSIMFTFLEFYETLLKFAMYKLFHTLDLRYPPVLDAELDGLDAGLATLKTQTVGGVTEEGEMSDGVEEEEQYRVLPTTKEERRAAKKKLKEEEKKIKSLEGKLGQIARADKAATAAAAADSAMANGARDKAFVPEEAGVRNGERDEEDVEMGEALTGPLEEAFMNKGGEGDEEDAFGTTVHGQGDVEDERRKRLFKGLRFFFGREVPKSWLEFVVLSCGGTVGWEGEGSPFTLEDPDITHQVMDRPTMTGPRRKRREYVQPQWLLDSLNARMLLPVARYAPGAVLPPHLSPFVDDAAEGYVPAYREELDRLRSAAEARRKEDIVPGEGRQGEEEGVVERSVGDDVAKGGDEDQDGGGVGEGVGEDGGGGDVEAAFARDLERERAGTSFSEASKKKQRRPQEEDDAEGEEDDDEGDEDDDEGEEDDDEGDVEEEEGEDEGGDEEAIGEVAPLKEKEKGAQTENEEHHELSKTMMSKKTKRLYGRMQHGLSKRREEIEKLKAKRKKLEVKYDATPNMAKANSSSAKKRRKLTKKNRSSSGVTEDAGKD